MSSPKSYLCMTASVAQDFHFQHRLYTRGLAAGYLQCANSFGAGPHRLHNSNPKSLSSNVLLSGCEGVSGLEKYFVVSCVCAERKLYCSE